MTDISQANLLERLGGKRNSNVVAALLENFSVAESALATSMDSVNSAMKENEIYLNSLQGKISIFKASFEDLSRTLIDSGFISGIVEMGTGGVEFLTKASDLLGKLGGLRTLLTSVATILGAVFGRGIQNGAKKGFGDIAAFFNLLKDGYGIQRNINGLKKIPAVFKSIGDTATAALAGVSGLQIALAAIGATITIVSMIKGAAETARQERISDAEVALEEAKKRTELISQLQEAYVVNNEYDNNVNKTTADEARYRGVVESVVEVLGDKAGVLKDLTAGTRDYIDALNGLIKAELNGSLSDIIAEEVAAGKALDAALNANGIKSGFGKGVGAISSGALSNLFTADDGGDIWRYVVDTLSDFTWGRRSENDKYFIPTGWERLFFAGGWHIRPSEGDYKMERIYDADKYQDVVTYYYKLREVQNKLIEDSEISKDDSLLNTEFYDELTKAISDLQPHIEALVSSQIKRGIASFQASNGLIKTIEDFEKAKRYIFEAYGAIPEEEVNKYLSGMGYSEFVIKTENDAYKAEARAKKVAAIYENIANKMSAKSENNPVAGVESAYEKLLLIEGITNLTDEDLEIASIIIEDQDIKNLNELTAAITEYREAYNQHARTAKANIDALWNSDGFSDAKKELKEIVETLGGISPDKIIELAGSNKDLAEILFSTGMSAEYLAHIFEELSKGNVGVLDEITGGVLKLNESLQGLASRFNEVTAARARYEAAMQAPEADDNFKSMAEAYEKLKAEIEAGRYNSNAFWASAEYIFGADQLAAWGWDDGIDKIKTAVKDVSTIFSDADSAGVGFIEKLYQISEAGQVLDENNNVIATIEKMADGGYGNIKIKADDIDALAEKMGLSKEAVLACVEALETFGTISFSNSKEVLDALEEVGAVAVESGKKAVNVDKLKTSMDNLGYTAKDVHDATEGLKALDNVVLIDTASDVDTLASSFKTLGAVSAKSNGKLSVNYKKLIDIMKGAGYAKDEISKVITEFGKLDNVEFSSDGVTVGIDDVQKHLDSVSAEKPKGEMDDVKDSAQGAKDIIDEVTTAINNLDGTEATVTLNLAGDLLSGLKEIVQRLGQIGAPTSNNSNKPVTAEPAGDEYVSGANGFRSSPHGIALTGEEGEELVQSGSEAYFVGSNGPEFVKLKQGDRVFTAEQTKRIKAGKSTPNDRFKALSGGENNTHKGGVTGYIPGDVVTKHTSTKTSASTMGMTFEEAYKYHQHLLAMEQESVQEYLDWLVDAYKKAYKRGEIKLDDFRKYEEEVFSKTRELFDDYLGDEEFKISMMEADGATPEELINAYAPAMAALAKKISEAYAAGYDETDEYLQKLLTKSQNYYDNVKKIREEAFDKSISDKEFDIKMLESEGADYKEVIKVYEDIRYSIAREISKLSNAGVGDDDSRMQDLMSRAIEAKEKVEDVYRDAFSYEMRNIDYDISYFEREGFNVDRILAAYDKARDAIYGEIIRLTNLGYGDDDEYVQELYDMAAEYAENAEQVYREVFARKAEDSEFNIYQLEYEEASPDIIREKYGELIKDIDAEIERARATGLTDDDDYIQELIKRRNDYADSVKDLNDEINNGAKDAYEELLDYKIKMNRQELESDKEVLNKKLSNLRDFIDKQKKLLKDEVDEEDYLEEQAEKRKAVNDLQAELRMLENDDSAWAQKRRLEIEDELKKAEDDLKKFERDHAVDKAIETLDDLYEKEEERINKKIETIDETLDDPKALRDQAIIDLRNESGTLLSDMIEWNNKYGSGNPQDVIDIFNNASNALKDYKTLTGSAYTPSTTSFTASDGTVYDIIGSSLGLDPNLLGIVDKTTLSGYKTAYNVAEDAITKSFENVAKAGKVLKSIINMGDIIVQGNADMKTVSEIRREQRESIESLISKLNQLNK